MVSINKRDLKIISYEFRSLANRVLNCNVENGIPLLKRFIGFIDSTEVISEYVQSYASKYEFAPPGDNQRYLYLGESLEEEIAEGYNYFKYIAENCTDFFREVTIGYSSKGTDGVKAFCNKLVLPFVNDIVDYLTKIEIRMGFDEESKYFIIANGENVQVNIADNHAAQENVQQNSIDEKHLLELMCAVRNAASEEDYRRVEKSLDTINRELSQKSPKKSVIRTAVTTLRGIKGTAEFMAAAAALVQFLAPFI